jgi:hypothetical protein
MNRLLDYMIERPTFSADAKSAGLVAAHAIPGGLVLE